MKKLLILTLIIIVLVTIFFSFKNYKLPSKHDETKLINVMDTSGVLISPDSVKLKVLCFIDWYQKNEIKLSEIYSADFLIKEELYIENKNSAINKYIQRLDESALYTKQFVEDIKFKMFYFALQENQGKFKNDINEGFAGDLILHTQILDDIFNAKNDITYINYLSNSENCIVTIDFASVKRKFYFKYEGSKWKIDKIEIAQ